MCGKTRQDKIRNEAIRERVGYHLRKGTIVVVHEGKNVVRVFQVNISRCKFGKLMFMIMV